jgi:hypothetical protein
VTDNDKRLIEDYIPIQAISAEASREKSVPKGHTSTLHLWWARRPLVACRAAVYGALVPASRFSPERAPDNKKHTGYREPVLVVRRIEVKGRRRGEAIRLATNDWYKAAQLGETHWRYVLWDSLSNPDPEPLRIQNPAKLLDHAKREVVAARYYDIPADAIESAAAVRRRDRD